MRCYLSNITVALWWEHVYLQTCLDCETRVMLHCGEIKALTAKEHLSFPESSKPAVRGAV